MYESTSCLCKYFDPVSPPPSNILNVFWGRSCTSIGKVTWQMTVLKAQTMTNDSWLK